MRLSPLEQLGLEVAAERLLSGNRGLGRMLACLLLADGKTVPATKLLTQRVIRPEKEPASLNTVHVRVCILRQALEDVGLEDEIVTHWGKGFSIKNPEAVLSRLQLEASA